MKQKLRHFFQTETVLCISAVLALISCFLVPPDSGYLAYIDTHTLVLLFCLMTVMAGFQQAGLFSKVSSFLLKNTGSQKSLALVLVLLCFCSSMIITNDVALITFVPLGILAMKMAGMEPQVCAIVTLMTIAANLGSMLTPIGNPQNLYLYSCAGLSLGEFLAITAPYTAISALLLLIALPFCCGTRSSSLRIEMAQSSLQTKPVILYSLLFVLALGAVAGIVSVWIVFAVVVVAVLAVDRTILKKVDYSLLATFAAFFIFIGNMGRLDVFYNFIAGIVSGNEQLTAVLSSQIISNVPAALLLSGFTSEWRELIVGTNLGGLGTLIASMASLISYKQICLHYPEKKSGYLICFTLWNVGFLAVQLIFSFVILPLFGV